MVRVKDNEHGKCFHIAAPDLGTVENSFASPSPFPSSAPSFGVNTSNAFTTAAASSSLFGSSQPLGFARFATPNAPSFGSTSPPSFGKCFHIAAPDLGTSEYSSASPSPFPSSAPSFGVNASNASTTAAASSSSFGSPQPLGFARFVTPNASLFGSTAPPSFGTSFPWSSNTSSVQNPSQATTFGFGPASAQPENTKFLAPQETPHPFQVSPFAQFPRSNNTSSAAANNNTCIFSSHGNAKTRSCACVGGLNNPSSGNNINSYPPKAATFDFGTASAQPENTKFLAPQETPYPFQVSPFAQFPRSNNTSSAAASNSTCIFSSHGNAKTRSCACVGGLNNPSSGNNINSYPPKAATFEFPINGNSSSAFSGDHATIFNTTTTRSCSCDGKLKNPPSENIISSTTPSVSSPLFGPSSVPPETTSFRAPQETPNPFQVPHFAQFPWSGSSTALPFYAAIPINNSYNGFTSLYGVPSSTNSKYPYGLPQHILLMALSPVPTTPLFSLPYIPYATPYDNQLKHCTCCCKCNKANDDPEPKHGFPGNNTGKANPPSSGFSFAPDVRRKIPFGTTWPGSSSSNSNNTDPFKFATPWDVHSPFPASPLVKKNKQPFECKYTETINEGGEKLMSISAMPCVGNQSVEELRWNNFQSQGTTTTRDGNRGGKENVGCRIQ